MTRVEKHKQYRTSLIHEGTSGLKTKDERIHLSSTDTLPFVTVMETVREENLEIDNVKKQLKKKYLTISIIVISAVVVVAIIAIIAVILFWKR